MQYCRNCRVGVKSHRSNSDRFLKPLKWEYIQVRQCLHLIFRTSYILLSENLFSVAPADLLQVCLLGV